MVNRLLNRPTLLMAASVVLFVSIAGLLIAGWLEPREWSTGLEIIGKTGSGQWSIPPYGPLTRLNVYGRATGQFHSHLFVLGSDGGGRDLLALIARGAVPSLLLVVCALVGRMLLGVTAGMAVGLGSGLTRGIAQVVAKWVAGFPYLALAIVLVQALSPNPTRRALLGFALAMAMVGWRDVAELTANRIQAVRVQQYAVAAKALGTQGLGFFGRHVLPHLRPALLIEIPFQASAVLVLLGELGYLGFYLGGNPIFWGGDGSSYKLPTQPEIGQLLSGAREYILREQWVPVLMPALVLAAVALAFELLGLALRSRERSRL
jgi:ABC-type dipeptide/oligopeptide/nickel transport system permease subunit